MADSRCWLRPERAGASVWWKSVSIFLNSPKGACPWRTAGPVRQGACAERLHLDVRVRIDRCPSQAQEVIVSLPPYSKKLREMSSGVGFVRRIIELRESLHQKRLYEHSDTEIRLSSAVPRDRLGQGTLP